MDEILIAMHNAIAAKSNNLAWDLIEHPALDAAQQVELVVLSATARRHHAAAGLPGPIAHADLLLGWALARAGAGEPAIHAAAGALSYFQTNAGQPWELAFAHAAMAAASLASGNEAAYREHYSQAQEIGADPDDPDLKYFAPAFASLPAP